MRNSSIINYPVNFIISLLNEWLDFPRDVLSVNNSLCNKEARPVFVEGLQALSIRSYFVNNFNFSFKYDHVNIQTVNLTGNYGHKLNNSNLVAICREFPNIKSICLSGRNSLSLFGVAVVLTEYLKELNNIEFCLENLFLNRSVLLIVEVVSLKFKSMHKLSLDNDVFSISGDVNSFEQDELKKRKASALCDDLYYQCAGIVHYNHKVSETLTEMLTIISKISEINLISLKWQCLANCDSLTASLRNLMMLSPNLTDLGIVSSPKVSNQQFKSLTANCTTLTRLQLSHCERLSSKYIARLLNNNRNLTTLICDDCPLLIPIKLLSNCSLRYLQFTEQTTLTFDSFDSIMQSCKNMSFVRVIDCPNITPAELSSIVEQRKPCCKVVTEFDSNTECVCSMLECSEECQLPHKLSCRIYDYDHQLPS